MYITFYRPSTLSTLFTLPGLGAYTMYLHVQLTQGMWFGSKQCLSCEGRKSQVCSSTDVIVIFTLDLWAEEVGAKNTAALCDGSYFVPIGCWI